MTEIPFERNVELSTARLLWAIFGAGQVHYAIAHYDGNTVSYRPVDQALEWTLIQRHLQKENVLGAYQLSPDSMVRWLAWDVDSPVRDTARGFALKIIQLLEEHDIPHAIEFSGSKGYHIFIFLEEPIPAGEAKQFVDGVRDTLGLPKVGTDHVEAFPKQEKLTPTNPYGNLIKLPLGEHPRTHEASRFVDPHNGWETAPPVEPQTVLQRLVSWKQVKKSIIAPDPLEQLVAVMTPIWREGDRHHIALSLSGFLAASGWGLEQTKTLVERIAEESGDEDLKNRLDCVKDTFRTLEEGKPIVGMSHLRDILPGGTLRQVVEIAGRLISPPMVKQIDMMRTMSKVPIFLRVRSAERVIWSDLCENGRPLQTTAGQEMYWYESETHRLINLEELSWESFLAKSYGINPKETFSKQLIQELKMHFFREARHTDVFRRSHWDGKRLYIHLDGAHVYILDGATIKVEYNGDCGVLFKNLGSQPTVIDPSVPLIPEYDIWDCLINDLTFISSANATATKAQQKELLRAWLLSFFFPELMATKPILCLLGVPGSGKTSALRRILWVFEDPFSDVLELVRDKPDAIRSSIMSHDLLVLDNLERTTARGLVDVLNRLATGANIEMRKLYTTNQTFRMRPQTFVAITAVNLPFSEETLFSRLLPIELEQIANPLPEHQLQKKIRDGRVHMWNSLLHELNQVVKCLLINQDPDLSQLTRLADYALFAKRLKGLGSVDYAQLQSGLQSLVGRQLDLLRESSPLIEILDNWITSDPIMAAEPHTLQELWNILQPLARVYGMSWPWKNSRSLSPHIRSLEGQLKAQLGCEIVSKSTRGRPRKAYQFRKDQTV